MQQFDAAREKAAALYLEKKPRLIHTQTDRR
jgi:hypothetical protein